MKSVIFTLLFLFFGTFAWSEPKNFVSAENEFSLIYPDELELAPSLPNAALVLRHKTKGYPSFNIVVQAGNYKALAYDSEKQTQAILDDYRRVGITDASAIHSFFARIAERNTFTLEVEYSSQNERYISSVTITSGKGRYYVLTYIDKADSFSDNRSLRDSLLENFKLWGSQTPPEILKSDHSSFFWPILWGFLILASFWAYKVIEPKLRT